VEVRLNNAEVMVRAVGGGLVDFWDLMSEVAVGSIGCVVAMVASYEGCH
jgi:hypothetical protein